MASVKGVRAEVLLHSLEEKGIYISSGSACASNKPAVSETLKAIGVRKELLDSTIRFSFSRFTTEEEIRSDDLAPNRIVEFAYLPDRLVRLKYLGSHRYLVLESQNSKLQADDEIEVQNFVLHHPLLVLQVWRHGEKLGQFTAGRISGLSSITLL